MEITLGHTYRWHATTEISLPNINMHKNIYCLTYF